MCLRCFYKIQSINYMNMEIMISNEGKIHAYETNVLTDFCSVKLKDEQLLFTLLLMKLTKLPRPVSHCGKLSSIY